MNGYNFTERVRRVLALGREEALALGHEQVDAEHELLGLLAERDGVGATVLQNLGVDMPGVASLVRRRLKPGRVRGRGDPVLPYTVRAKRVLEYSMSEARELNHSYVGTEHLLIGLLRAAGVGLEGALGITAEAARAETLRILGVEIDLAEKLPPPAGEAPTRIELVLHYSNGAIVTKRFADAAGARQFLSSPNV